MYDPVPTTHLQLSDLCPPITTIWAGAAGDEQRMAAYLVDFLVALDARSVVPSSARLPPPDTPSDTPPDPQLVAIALETARDGKQRAADVEWDSPTNLEAARLALRNELNDTAIPVQPWIWKQSTSGGTALTNAGRHLGVELRFSRKRKA